MKKTFFFLRTTALLTLLSLLTAMSCDDSTTYLSIYNSGDEDIYFLIDHADVILSPSDFDRPPKRSEMIEYEDMRRLEVPDIDSLQFRTLLIFKKSTIENHSWQEIQQQNIFDARYEIPYDQYYSESHPLIYTGS